MKSYKIIITLAAAALALSACADKAAINGVLSGAADKEVIVKQLNVNSYSVLDTIKTKADGSFSYKVDVKKGQPEFIYLFYGDTRVAGLLLESGETAKVTADTLGKYEVTGSEGSAKLAEVDSRYSNFINEALKCKDNGELAKLYVKHYRESVKYVLGNSKSLTCIPVLYEQFTNEIPVFSNRTDAIIFRGITDSLKTVYPESVYVKALDKETVRREKILGIESQLDGAAQLGYPDLNLPDMKGRKVAISSLDSKVTLVHFWDSSQPAHSLLNNESLLPIYNDFHSRGFEIYSVCLDLDKTRWGNVVNSQKLPWINVNDGLGGNCPAIVLYNIQNLPQSVLIVDGNISTTQISGAEGLRKELGNLLRQ